MSNYAIRTISIVVLFIGFSLWLMHYTLEKRPCESAAEMKGFIYQESSIIQGCIVNDGKGGLYKIWTRTFHVTKIN